MNKIKLKKLSFSKEIVAKLQNPNTKENKGTWSCYKQSCMPRNNK